MADDSDPLLALATRLDKAASEISRQTTEVHDVADELAAMAEDGGGVEPPDPEPPAEGAHPADPASWTVTNLVDATQHSLALPVELRGPGLVVASFSGEHATKLELGALDGFTGTDPAVLAGNTLRLYHRALAANERLNMLTLLVSPAELVLGWIGWFPDEDGEFVIATVGSAATNAAGIEIMLPSLPAGALVISAVADNWGTADVWACHDTTEVQDAARTDAGGHGQAVAVRVGAPAGDRTMRWTRATPASRVIGAALVFDTKATVIPDPEAPPEPEPGPDPEPPEPEPPSPPTEGLEPPVAGATHVGLKVGPARQTVTAIGFGLGSPRGQSPASTLAKHAKVLVRDPGANSIRLNGPSTSYVDSCKALAEAGIKLVHVTSYEENLTTNPVGSAKSFVGGVMQLLSKGVKVTSVSSRNEPSYRLWGGDKARAIHKAYREELDRQGLQKIVLVSPEFANTDSWSHDCARDLKSMMGKEIGAWGCHSYGLGLDEKLSQMVLPQGIAFVQHESGYGSWTSTCAKILNDRNRGCAGWDFHRAHQTQPDGDLSQSLIAYSGAPTGHYYAWLRIALTLPLGTRIYQVTRNSVTGDDAKHMHFKRTFSSTVYAAAGKRSDGRWGICVFNNGASTLQALVELPEKRNAECRGVIANGAKAREVRVSMKEGQLRTPALAKGDLLAVVG